MAGSSSATWTSMARRGKLPTPVAVARLAHADLRSMGDRRFGDPPFHLARLVSKHTLSQCLAAASNHRTLRLHESLLPNRQVGAVRRSLKWARAPTSSG